MNILLLGSGGREHALAWKIKQSPLSDKLYIAPGNAGTALCGTNVPISSTDFSAIEKFVIDHMIQMVVVGPEDPLVAGIHDYFLSHDHLKSIPVIGPVKAGAQLEGSKDFSKEFMNRYSIPTAAYRSFKRETLQDGLTYIEGCKAPFVLKADGLAAGKGVIICQSKEEAKKELSEMLVNAKFGQASNKVVIEEFLDGIELSCFVLTDGNSYKILPSAKDYKRIGDGDTGLNTGGMGAVSPVSFADQSFMSKVEQRIILPTINGLKKEGISYKGFLFIGLMNVKDEPFVIEYNVRLGDPETEVVVPRIKSDIVELFLGVASETLHQKTMETDERTAVTVMLVSGGYPGEYEKGKTISGLEKIKDSIVFHAGTSGSPDGTIKTSGGRVLAVTSYGKDILSALQLSYKNAGTIKYDKIYYRKDIGLDLVHIQEKQSL
jgi:phosphoribosylamine---glycine ligase